MADEASREHEAVATAIRCPACGGTPAPDLVPVPELMFGTGEMFAFHVCASCATLWLADAPVDLSPYYPDDYYSIDVDPEVGIGRPGARQLATVVGRSVLFGRGRVARTTRALVPMRQFHSFVRVLESVAFAGLPQGRQTRVLDVGCGSGLLVYALAMAGVEMAVGVDPFAPTDRSFDNGARVLRRELADVEEQYDLVMYHHSFEHVVDPRTSLLAAARLLCPGGRILIRMPTVSSDAYETYGPSWIQLDPPRHLTLFSRAGVDELASQCGLKVTASMDDSSSFQFWGSEQAKNGLPLMASTSQMIDPARSSFGRKQIAEWERAAQRLNAADRGDQAAWVLERS